MLVVGLGLTLSAQAAQTDDSLTPSSPKVLCNQDLSANTPATSSDNSVNLEYTLPAGTRWVMVSVKKDGGDSYDQVTSLPAAEGTFSRRLYLAPGSGNYSIDLFTSSQSNSPAGSFGFSCEAQVVNSGPQGMQYLLPSPNVESDDPEIINLAKSITASASTDREKSVAIHNWITKNIPYDTVDYFNHVNPISDALTILHTKTGAVCEGYSNLNAALHRAVGIQAQVIHGFGDPNGGSDMSCSKGRNHAWNKVLINGEWLLQDTTWDAGYVDPNSQEFLKAPQKVFLFPKPEKFAKTHVECGVED